MDPNQDLTDFKNAFFGYANYITAYSKRGEVLTNKIFQNKDKFNSLSESERLQFVKNDPDFVELQSIVSKLETAYYLYYNFIAENMQNTKQVKVETPDELVPKPQEVQAPVGYEDVD
jgi:hypothetical protein